MAVDGIKRMPMAATPRLQAASGGPAAPAALPTAAALRPLAAASGKGIGGATAPWQPLAASAGGSQRQAIAAVKDFEAVFLRQLAGVMTRSASGLAAGSEGAAFYQGMIEEQLGRLLAERGGGMGLQSALLARLAGQSEGAADVAR